MLFLLRLLRDRSIASAFAGLVLTVAITVAKTVLRIPPDDTGDR